MLKRSLSFLLLFSLLLGLAACGAGGNSTTVHRGNGLDIKLTESTVERLASDGNKDEGTETVTLKQVTITFSRLPENAEDVALIDRTGENGKFITIALLICAYKAWTPEDPDTCAEMMRLLMDSPVASNTYTAYTKQFVKDRMLQNSKWEYIADAYFDGSTPENGYTPDKPISITLREYPYLPQLSTSYGEEIYVDRVVTDFEGADTERMISVYEDPKDRTWYIFSDTYGGLLADVKQPNTD